MIKLDPRFITSFQPELVKASKKALIELVRILWNYRKSLILIGGWVPYLILEEHQQRDDPFVHIGSIDIDWVVDPLKIEPDQYSTIKELLVEAGWKRSEKSEFTYARRIIGDDGFERTITTDFLTPRREDASKSKRHEEVQTGFKARNFDSAVIAVKHNTLRTMEGTLPNGARTKVSFNMLDLIGCVGTKSMALSERYKHKDAYDIVSVIYHYGSGISDVTNQFERCLSEEPLTLALEKLEEKFRRINSEGPVLYADFIHGGEGQGTDLDRQTAYQVVNEFLRLLGKIDVN